MYAGTIFATAKNKNINLHSNIGNITVDEVLHQKDFKKIVSDTGKSLSINTIKGIIFVTTQ